MISVSKSEYEIIKNILKEHVKKGRVLAFGSRFKWTNRDYSDLDIAIDTLEKLKVSDIFAIKNAFEESKLPYSLDIIDYNNISDSFKSIIDSGNEIIYESGEWEEVSLGDICQINRGASPRPIHEYISDTGMPWVKIADATASLSRYIERTKEFIDLSGVAKSVKVGVGTLIVSNSATPGVPKIMGIEACVHDGWIVISNISSIALKEFLYYQFLYIKSRLNSQASGTVFQNLKTDIVKNFRIKLPPVPTQKRIAGILSSLDNKIELNNKINKNLESMAEAIFKEWFINFNFPNTKGKPYKSSGGKMIDSELGSIPEGWKILKSSDFFDITIGKTPPRNENECFSTDSKDIKWVSISDMGKNGIYLVCTNEYLTKEAVEKYNVQIIPKNTVILSFKLTMGRVSITNENMTTNEAIAHFKTDDKEINEYVYFYLKNLDYYSLGSTSSIAQAINSKIIKSIRLVIPEKNILNNFHSIAGEIFNKIKLNQIENQKLSAIRDALLPKLMSGEIRV